ncbi:SDR family oxidoreductase [Paraburkholderia sp. A3BS-1L]|uniref:SDR family oxidoreductase n=1 Tax=Paraburkholderia sp. A3BS-1L TaxID=3028375 RepID=UPI003DA86562
MVVKKLLQLDGRVALVTGGSRGLGLQMAEALGDMGCMVVMSARKADELAAAETQLRARGIDARAVVFDLQKFDRIPALVDEVLSTHGCVDVLVNNAGATWGAPAEEYPDEAWHKVMNLNVSAPFSLTREIARRSMIPRRSGKIINIASIAGLRGSLEGITRIAYNTSKAAMINLTRALATEWGRHGINVNAICPGFLPTKMTAGHLDRAGEQMIERTPLRRLGGDEDLKGALVYFASDASRHVTGRYLAIDGGVSA